MTPQLMENLGAMIEILHVPSKQAVSFKAFLTSFKDSYKQEWNKERVIGRNDPHQIYSGTERVITLAWDSPHESIEQAWDTMYKCSLLGQMQYPVYSREKSSNRLGNAITIKGSPIFRIKFMNFIQNANGTGTKSSVSASGLYGRLDGFDFEPVIENGFFHMEPDYPGISELGVLADGQLLPYLVKFSLTFSVLHDHFLGYNESGKFRKNGFPYGIKQESNPNLYSTNTGDKDTEQIRAAMGNSILKGNFKS